MLKDTLNNGTTALSQHHSRLLLEDVLVLHPGEMVVCLISRKHPFFVKSATKKQWIGKLEKEIRNNPLKPVVINKVIFFPFNLRIRSNPNGDVLTAGILSRDELVRNVTSESYGAGVIGQLETNDTELFKFVNFFNHVGIQSNSGVTQEPIACATLKKSWVMCVPLI